MAKSIDLILGCHSHQPVGNFEHIFEESFEKAYRPFVDVLERFPEVRFTQHFTGPLLDWFKEHRPDFLDRLRAMAQAGQIEIMGGAYYEPLLCAIPERDAVAQIERMNRFCETHFGQPPRGMWLAERVWEPHMPRILRQAGIDYTALDDTHFIWSGCTPDQLHGYYVTEDEGSSIKVFPIDKKLRYIVPFHMVHESIDYLKELADDTGRACVVLHDDGEKFGVWPETYRSVYEEGWLKEFFQELTNNRDWINCTTYATYLDRVPALGRIYLTCASYQEMTEWALPAERQRSIKRVEKAVKERLDDVEEALQFIRGGFWRNFLGKYDESNNLHKRMLVVSREILALKDKKDPRVLEAEVCLHKAQCNCGYWHGVFGGLYLNHIRTAIYENLIKAECLLDSVRHGDTAWVGVEQYDFDGDGNDEVILKNEHLWLGIKPTDGGSLFEWDIKAKAFNIGSVLTRRDELYHDDLRSGRVSVGESGQGDASIHELVRAKEDGLENFLIYDPYRRVSLRDHFLPQDVSLEDFRGPALPEMGEFPTAVYSCETGDGRVTLTCSRPVGRETEVILQVVKTISLAPRASTFEIRYDISVEGQGEWQGLFGVEFALNLLSGTAFDRYYRSDARDLGNPMLGESARDKGLTHIAVRDDWQGLECGLRWADLADVFRFPIETVSQSEGGQERIYQGSVMTPCWPVHCVPGKTVTIVITAESLDSSQSAGN